MLACLVLSESDLAADLGLDLDRATRSIYLDVDYENTRGPTLAEGADPRAINRWMLGDTNNSGTVESADGGDEPKTKIFLIDRYRGEPVRVEVQP